MRFRRLILQHGQRDFAARSVEAVFLMLIVLALGVGGARAVKGVPILASLLVPPGLMAAKAADDVPPGTAVLRMTATAAQSAFSPEVLTPVAARGFPDWLTERIAENQMPSVQPVAPSRTPVIAIVIDDMGADPVSNRRAIALPRSVTLSFLPYPASTPQLAREAARAGHEILVHVPMEPVGKNDPGPNALLPDLSSAEIRRRLNWALGVVPGFDGINNHEGSKFTADRTALVPVIEDLADRHAFFLDSHTTTESLVVPLARAFGVASAKRDVFLDDIQTPAAIATQLAQTEALARRDGVVIAIGHPHPATLDALAAWTATLKGYDLVPVREAIRMKTERDVQSLSLAGR